ncbi:Endothelial PAS domain-containing protein 1 [Liparis tanakae]|uniref:Endothelial PAS domain-containing protein 1 n=1 Tax=Liparis tanakae TaxID=230148 RepID=A0A4Z2HRN8_9TELE|nr:Endothelial PAS domain-containing protein 1 [Liparis tanakae]
MWDASRANFHHDAGSRRLLEAMTADKEKRRAVSREAARRRRRVESEVFEDLSRLLPLPPSVQAHLDKPSVIRLTLSYMRMHTLLKGEAWTKAQATHRVKCGRAMSGEGEPRKHDGGREEEEEEKETEKVEASEETDLYLRILEGFLIVLSTEGDMIYLSDNVSKYMGLTQNELMGHNIFEFTHPCDHEEIRNSLRLTPVCFKSQSVSGQYRMLVRSGGYVWVETHSAVIPGCRPSKSRPGANQPLCILCVTYVLSGVEEPSLQLSVDQIVHI